MAKDNTPKEEKMSIELCRILNLNLKDAMQADWCFNNRVSNIFKYCPKCGADMRKKEGKHEQQSKRRSRGA